MDFFSLFPLVSAVSIGLSSLNQLLHDIDSQPTIRFQSMFRLLKNDLNSSSFGMKGARASVATADRRKRSKKTKKICSTHFRLFITWTLKWKWTQPEPNICSCICNKMTENVNWISVKYAFGQNLFKLNSIYFE